MAVYDLEEQEQISAIKAWWEQYGNIVTGLAVAAAIAVVSWQGYGWYQTNNAAQAAALYHEVELAVEQNDSAKARESAGQIIESHPGSPYAVMAALMSAATQFQSGDYRNAAAHLEWVKANAGNPVLVELAAVRLATVRLSAGDADAALLELDSVEPVSLKGRFDDLRGDILVMKGDYAGAATAYRAALDAFAVSATEGAKALQEVTRIKLETLES